MVVSGLIMDVVQGARAIRLTGLRNRRGSGYSTSMSFYKVNHWFSRHTKKIPAFEMASLNVQDSSLNSDLTTKDPCVSLYCSIWI